MEQEIDILLWNRVAKYGKFLQMVPFVRMVAVCNNLALGNVHADSDIDLFVVAKSGRMFLVRTFITFIFQVLGVRRHGKYVKHRFCLSFFIDDSNFDFSNIALDNDFYLAYWLPNIKPIIDNDNFSDEFLDSNSWIYRFFDNKIFISKSKLLKIDKFYNSLNKLFSFIFSGFFGDFLEKRLMVWQLKRSKNKAKLATEKSSLIINEHMLKFHNNDRRSYYNNNLINRYGLNFKFNSSKKFTFL